ncbi:MAG TPA: porin [Alphaproteobacteria bacterium]|nr:porin [Alphaproteobacteria bacterium]
MHVRSLLLAGSVAGLAFGTFHSTAGAAIASAQTTQQAITAQQAQIDYLKHQLEIMSEQLQQMQVKAAAPAKADVKPAPKVTQSASNKFAIESADGQYSIGLTGGFQGDVGYYPGFDAQSKTGPQNLHAGFNARRARIGVTGKAAGDFAYTFIYDAGNSSDATPKGINTAQVSYLGIKNLAIDFGYSNVNFTLDQATSSYDTIFMERATPSNIATAFNGGDNRSNIGARYFNDRLWVGAYVTGPAPGEVHGQPERIGAFQRVAYQVLADPNYSLHVGFAVDELFKAPLNNGNAAATSLTYDPVKGIVTTTVPSAYSISLSDQPELRVDPATFVNSGSLGSLTNPLSGAQVYDLELAGNYGPLFAQGEYFHYSVDREGLPTASFDGGYGLIAYTLTGESHKYVPGTASYARIVPAHAFSPAEGFWGAWEVAGRVSYIDMTSNFHSGQTTSSSSAALNGGKQTSYTVGLNWYPNSYMRFELNYIHTDFDKVNSGTSGTLGAPIGAAIDALGFRTQVNW